MIPKATPEDRALVDAYLARAATLTPADWGRLEALGSRLADGTPFGWLDRARLDGAVYGLWNVVPRSVATGAALAVRAAFRGTVGILTALNELTDPTGERMRRRVAALSEQAKQREAGHPEAAQSREDYSRLAAIAREPGRLGPAWLGTNAGRALRFGLIALRNRPRLSASAFETAYAPVEPVIPFRTLAAIPSLAPAAV